MYIKQLNIQNIRAISDLEITFEQPAGWHVLIGDNGQGKTSVLRAVVLAMFADRAIDTFRTNSSKILKEGQSESKVTLNIENVLKDVLEFYYKIQLQPSHIIGLQTHANIINDVNRKENLMFFSMSFGAVRRFFGKSDELNEMQKFDKYLAAHFPLFNDDVVFDSPVEWLKSLNYKKFVEKNESSSFILKYLFDFINNSNLLPNKIKFTNISSDTLHFTNEDNITVTLHDLSSGYISVLCIVLTILMRMVETNAPEEVFANFKNEDYTIPIKGFILIDEIDAHLHPEWQNRIGKWFTQYFPNIQFIVTTHSPLICRACAKGSIWQLKDGGATQVLGVAKERLVYGNILEATGTNLFGENMSVDEKTPELRNRLGELYEKSMMGLIESKDEAEFEHLKSIFPTFKPAFVK
ncbi:MAG: hypothetical protein RI894_1670 [Bacteroidota bacterium]|jgi:predicted ATP-binding protein involved in virulence